MQLWKRFLTLKEIAFPDQSRMIRIMLSIPHNTGWVERAYSVLENIFQKRRNRLEVGLLMHQFFISVQKLPIRNSYGYSKELERYDCKICKYVVKKFFS